MICSRCSSACCGGAGVISRVDSSSSSPLRARWCCDPTLLILDEPTEGIQPNIVHEIGEVIQRLNREANLTVLLVEQKLPFARRVASHLRMLDKGRLVVSGSIADADR